MKIILIKAGEVVEFLKQTPTILKLARESLQRWWKHGPIDAETAERIDRICHPEKYLGKD